MEIVTSGMDRASPEPEKGPALHGTAQSDLLTSASACSHGSCSFFSWQHVSERDKAGQLTPNEANISGCTPKSR